MLNILNFNDAKLTFIVEYGIINSVKHQINSKKENGMEISRFETKDLESVCNFVKNEYITAQSSDGCEHDTVKQIILSDGYVPGLTFEVWDNGFLIGFIMLYRSTVTDKDGNEYEVLRFGPAAVKESHRGRGVGSAMMRYALRQAKWLGYDSVVISGQSGFYGKFGFVPDKTYTGLMHLNLNPAPQPTRIFIGV